MAHTRKRHLEGLFRKLLRFSPIIGVFGHRQVGKSTFIASEANEYRTLDDVEQLESANNDPKGFISATHKSPLAIDECQMEPKLFPTLKEWVRTHKKPGGFILSGSVRFTSRKAIRESLAGRMSTLEMLPFSVSELAGEPLADIIPNLLNHRIFSNDSLRCLNSRKSATRFKREFEIFLENGGLPGLCFIRSAELKRKALNDLHDLILSRDLGLVSDIRTPISTMKKLLVYIGKHPFEPYNSAEIRRQLGLAPATQNKLLYAMESIFLIRRIPIPLRKKETILLEDQYEEWIYSDRVLDTVRQHETAVYRNIRTQFAYQLDQDAQFEMYLTRDHARVPIVIRLQEKILGIIISSGKKPSLSESRSASSFLKSYSGAKLLFLTSEDIEPVIFDERTLMCSIFKVI